MAREPIRTMRTAATRTRTGYVGAYLPDEGRLTLAQVDPEEPWDAFRALRRAMRKQGGKRAEVALYESAAPIQQQAEVISLEDRRRAG